MRNIISIAFLSIFLMGCGFHLQSERSLPAPLNRLYLQTNDPYGFFARQLQQKLKTANVELVSEAKQATTILHVTHDETSQELLSVSGTQQTRQYNLHVTIQFDVSKASGETILPTQTLIETRTITILANQILGGSNESTVYYQQMRESLARAVINRLASKEVAEIMHNAFPSRTSSR